MQGRMLPGATASSYEVNGRTVHVGRSLPIRIRYEAEWGEPNGTGLPIVRFFYRDRWLNTWAVGAQAHLDGELDRALGGQVRLRVHVSRFTGELVDGSMYAEPLAQPKRMLLLGPMRHRPRRPYGPDEGSQVAIDAVLRYLYHDPEKAAADHGHHLDERLRVGGGPVPVSEETRPTARPPSIDDAILMSADILLTCELRERPTWPPRAARHEDLRSKNMTPVEELESAVLALPRAERARLAERLLASLDEDPDVEEAWIEEVRQRLAEYRAGEAETVSADDVMREAKNRLRS